MYTVHSVCHARHVTLAVTRTPLPPVCSRCVPPRGQAAAKIPLSPYFCGLLSYAERKACLWVCALRGSTYILLEPSHSVRGVCWGFTVLGGWLYGFVWREGA
jgi:hypothetical protein